MAPAVNAAHLIPPPGTEEPRRYRPRLRYELLGCGLHGHMLLGTDAASLRAEDTLFARESGGLRWHRCLRCDAWVALPPPTAPAARFPPNREDVVLPLRGRPLRDQYVLRLIALDRVLHFVVLAILAAALFLLAGNKQALDADYRHLLGVLPGDFSSTDPDLLGYLRRLFAISTGSLYLIGMGAITYAALEGTEAIGLWLGRRWAEYLTFIGNTVFVPYEVWELTRGISVLKVSALLANLLIVAYLLLAKRLFGLRGGGAADRAERDADTGWAVIEAATPAGTPGD